jgi:hypothetical protein
MYSYFIRLCLAICDRLLVTMSTTSVSGNRWVVSSIIYVHQITLENPPEDHARLQIFHD